MAAVNEWEDSPEGFLITYTDDGGNYQFSNVLSGDYQVGVYKHGYASNPAMRYFALDYGSEMTEQNFVLGQGTFVKTREHTIRPRTINLSQNFPNPFNPSTTIKFDLPKTTEIDLYIYNAMGQRIRTLLKGSLNAGQHQVEWDGKNDDGHGVPSGIYFYQLRAGDYNKIMKMIFAK